MPIAQTALRMHISQVTRKLEKIGYVCRSPSEEVRRVQLIQLTHSGISKLEEVLRLVEVTDEEFFSEQLCCYRATGRFVPPSCCQRRENSWSTASGIWLCSQMSAAFWQGFAAGL